MASIPPMRHVAKSSSRYIVHRTISTQTPRLSRVPDWKTTSGGALALGLSNTESPSSSSSSSSSTSAVSSSTLQPRRSRNDTVLGSTFKGRHEALTRVRAADPDFNNPAGMIARAQAKADATVAAALDRFQARRWKAGDVYSPNDLTPGEMRKWRKSQRPGRDVFDVLGLDPMAEWKNYTLLSEYMTTMGRIKHSRDTGLRPVNQRKIAKAIRRAVGMGLMPSVHIHPEMLRRPM